MRSSWADRLEYMRAPCMLVSLNKLVHVRILSWSSKRKVFGLGACSHALHAPNPNTLGFEVL